MTGPADDPRAAGRIAQRFAALRRRDERALVTYVMAGDPDLATSLAIVQTLADSGADVVELGLPFSDPIADGPVIQAAGLRAQAAGINTGRFLELVARVRQGGCPVPLVAMTYYNPVLQRGLGRFCQEAQAAGLDGLIIPDLPMDEAADLAAACREQGLDLVAMLAPTSTPDRIATVARQATGFVYCVALTGVTGARAQLSQQFLPVVADLRRQTEVPVVVGFGIATADQVRQVGQVADGAVVGSALVRLCGQQVSRPEILASIAQATRALKAGTRER